MSGSTSESFIELKAGVARSPVPLVESSMGMVFSPGPGALPVRHHWPRAGVSEISGGPNLWFESQVEDPSLPVPLQGESEEEKREGEEESLRKDQVVQVEQVSILSPFQCSFHNYMVISLYIV
ncbi:hypothetical protein ACOMHN_060788 [Nucella lapillus]